jgi:hypothetical protein
MRLDDEVCGDFPSNRKIYMPCGKERNQRHVDLDNLSVLGWRCHRTFAVSLEVSNSGMFVGLVNQ